MSDMREKAQEWLGAHWTAPELGDAHRSFEDDLCEMTAFVQRVYDEAIEKCEVSITDKAMVLERNKVSPGIIAGMTYARATIRALKSGGGK